MFGIEIGTTTYCSAYSTATLTKTPIHSTEYRACYVKLNRKVIWIRPSVDLFQIHTSGATFIYIVNSLLLDSLYFI